MKIRSQLKNRFTIVPNSILHNKNLNLKLIGLISLLLSFSDDFDYSVETISNYVGDGVSSIRSGLKMLEELGYLQRKVLRDENGVITDWEYIVYDEPQQNDVENGKNENLESKCSESNVLLKKCYGKYKNVYLSDLQYDEITSHVNGNAAIEYLSEYMEMTGKHYANHYLAINKFCFDAVMERQYGKNYKNNKNSNELEIHKLSKTELVSLFENLDDVVI